jgi:hypothetical protein
MNFQIEKNLELTIFSLKQITENIANVIRELISMLQSILNPLSKKN